jgi:hypothetical protein
MPLTESPKVNHPVEDEIRHWGRAVDGLLSFKVAKLERKLFRVCLDVDEESNREAVHDAFARWKFGYEQTHPQSEEIQWATFIPEEEEERQEFFAGCNPPGETILFDARRALPHR